MEVKSEVTINNGTVTVPLHLSMVWEGIWRFEFTGNLLLKRTQEGTLSLALENWNLRTRSDSEGR